MPKHEFCDTCPDCRPALLDLTTRTVMADTEPVMIAINEVWDHQTSYGERKAFIDVTYHNSRNENDLALTKKVTEMFEAELKKMEGEQ